jgi:hypothetical protein
MALSQVSREWRQFFVVHFELHVFWTVQALAKFDPAKYHATAKADIEQARKKMEEARTTSRTIWLDLVLPHNKYSFWVNWLLDTGISFRQTPSDEKLASVGSQVSVDAPDARRCPTTASILLRSDLH